MAITIWRGYRSFTHTGDYENVIYETAKEIGSVRFEDADEVIQVRIIETEDGEIIIHHATRTGYDTVAEIFEYPTLEEAVKENRFLLKKAGVI
jgi:hypothetical protein